ncbi:MAG: hypothetical protein AAF280_07225 [Pseudomonadota bacterium]
MTMRNGDMLGGAATGGETLGVVVPLNTPFRQRSKRARQTAVMQRFAETRRGPDDVFWLKENAEILGVFEATGLGADAAGLSVYQAFYDDLETRAGFFPQYYRFFLSLALDLEDLGLCGDMGERMAQWVAEAGFVAAELSDLQRAEARRLCARRGVQVAVDAGLDDRLRSFCERSETFALPNKKAAYELTHIVFYLSEYGRRDPGIGAGSILSLRNAGTLAFLELNIDLLSEICIALRFAGEDPPEIWERWLRDQVRRFAAERTEAPVPHDDYHPWLMLNWFMEVTGRGGFGIEMPDANGGSVVFVAPSPAAAPLRELSNSLYQQGPERRENWALMREAVEQGMSEDARHVLEAAETAVDFDAFFRGFARASGPRVMASGGLS